MLSFFLIFAAISLPFVDSQTQTCSDGGIGACVGDVCPSGFTCLDPRTPQQACCDDTLIVIVTTPQPTTVPPVVTTAPPSTSCVDQINPKTGVSDCPQRTAYCNNDVYYDLMTQQCPQTCGRCSGGGTGTGGTGGGTNCVDKKNPRTGVSDCPQRTGYCNNQIYFDLMTDQCPQTCGRCSISAGPSTGGTGTSGGCVDLINPSTGTSDCPGMASYCSNQYYELMTEQCPKTCNRCTSSGGSSNTGSTGGISSGGCVDKINPSTGTSDCPGMVSYCTDQTYYALMTDQCPMTCGRCSG